MRCGDREEALICRRQILRHLHKLQISVVAKLERFCIYVLSLHINDHCLGKKHFFHTFAREAMVENYVLDF